jgi:hypothetical protein
MKAACWCCNGDRNRGAGRLSRMEQLPGLPQAAFDKVDCEPDAAFYAYPRFVTHIDDKAIAAVTEAYRELLPPGGAVLDLMSSWVSHVPEDQVCRRRRAGHERAFRGPANASRTCRSSGVNATVVAAGMIFIPPTNHDSRLSDSGY